MCCSIMFCAFALVLVQHDLPVTMATCCLRFLVPFRQGGHVSEEQAGLCSPCPDAWSASSACFLLWTEQHLLVGGRPVFAAP